MNNTPPKPRRWTLAYDSNFDDHPPVVSSGPKVTPEEDEVEVVEASALTQAEAEITRLVGEKMALAGKLMKDLPEYLALEKERDQLRADAIAARDERDCAFEQLDELKKEVARLESALEHSGNTGLSLAKVNLELRAEVEILKHGWDSRLAIAVEALEKIAPFESREGYMATGALAKIRGEGV